MECQYDLCKRLKGQFCVSFSLSTRRICATSHRSAWVRVALCPKTRFSVLQLPYTKYAQCLAHLVVNLLSRNLLCVFQSTSYGCLHVLPISSRPRFGPALAFFQPSATPHYQSILTCVGLISGCPSDTMGIRAFLEVIRWCILHRNCGHILRFGNWQLSPYKCSTGCLR